MGWDYEHNRLDQTEFCRDCATARLQYLYEIAVKRARGPGSDYQELAELFVEIAGAELRKRRKENHESAP